MPWLLIYACAIGLLCGGSFAGLGTWLSIVCLPPPVLRPLGVAASAVVGIILTVLAALYSGAWLYDTLGIR